MATRKLIKRYTAAELDRLAAKDGDRSDLEARRFHEQAGGCWG